MAAIAFAGVFIGADALGHCEIPCGIYGDRIRIDMIAEDIRTVENSMQQIKTLRETPEQNTNQLVRWVVNKEEHAHRVQKTVYQYFMNQRVKPAEKTDAKAYERYVTQSTLLSRMLLTSMECKQTTDETHVKELRSLLSSRKSLLHGKRAGA
jgi:nickel superoxide dismutase